jgi:hypothetical protein
MIKINEVIEIIEVLTAVATLLELYVVKRVETDFSFKYRVISVDIHWIDKQTVAVCCTVMFESGVINKKTSAVAITCLPCELVERIL